MLTRARCVHTHPHSPQRPPIPPPPLLHRQKFPEAAVEFADMTILGESGQSLTPSWDVVSNTQCKGETSVVDPLKLITIQCDPTA